MWLRCAADLTKLACCTRLSKGFCITLQSYLHKSKLCCLLYPIVWPACFQGCVFPGFSACHPHNSFQVSPLISSPLISNTCALSAAHSDVCQHSAMQASYTQPGESCRRVTREDLATSTTATAVQHSVCGILMGLCASACCCVCTCKVMSSAWQCIQGSHHQPYLEGKLLRSLQPPPHMTPPPPPHRGEPYRLYQRSG